MTNLEDRLHSIKRVPVSDVDVIVARDKIMQHKKQTLSLMPIFVAATMFAIMCVLIFLPASKMDEKAASTVINKQIEEVVYLKNNQPYFNHDPNSFNYAIAKYKVKDAAAIAQLQEILTEAIQTPTPWTHKPDSFETYEVALNFTDGTTQRLKVDIYSGEKEYIYDINNNLQYEMEVGSGIYSWFYENEKDVNLWIILLIISCITIAFAIPSHYYRKKYGILDEQGKFKQLSGWRKVVPYFIFMVPFFMMGTIIGTFHIGLSLILFFSYLIIVSYMEIRIGIIRRNQFYVKVILTSYIAAAILGLLIALIF